MAALHDNHSRSKVDAIRRGSIEIFAQRGHVWNEGVFLQTLKTMKEHGDIQLQQHYSLAEISPTLKKRIARFAERRLSIDDPSEEIMQDSL